MTQPANATGVMNAPRIFTCAFIALIVLHFPLAGLPYFWDEAGYYIPAAYDLLLTGSLIPHSTPSNAHPPLVMAWLALWWKLAGFAPAVTRVAMLAVAAFGLTGLFRLARRIANAEVAIASVICTMLYPVFFAQSSMAHVDMAAAAFTFWALDAYFGEHFAMTAFWFSVAVLAKETAILGPCALLAWEIAKHLFSRVISSPVAWPASTSRAVEKAAFRGIAGRLVALAFPAVPLALWYCYHYVRTGFIFGNPEFFRYNVASTTNPLRILLALLMRLYQTVGYLNLFVLTLATACAMTCAPLTDGNQARQRIAPNVQFTLLAVIMAYVLALSVIGGAVLARYMLPVVPLVITICLSTLRRRLRWWRLAVGVVMLAFVAGLFINPPHGFSPEDNLAYSDFIRLHRHAEQFLEERYPHARVLTAWPADDELTRPYLGYVTRPMRVVRIEDFTAEELLSARDQGGLFDVAFVFSTKYDPPRNWFERWPTWQVWKTRFFGYHRDVPPEAAAQILGGRLVYSERRKGEWVGVVEMEQVEEARR